jgi:hypothetical protein
VSLNPYLKAITGAVVAGLGAAESAVIASPHHSIDLASGIVVAITTLSALGGVYATSNSRTTAAVPAAEPSVQPTVHAASVAALPPLPPVTTEGAPSTVTPIDGAPSNPQPAGYMGT